MAVVRVGLAGALLLWGSVATAGPLAAPGDRQLRQDVEALKAEGLIDGPIDSWPLPWAQIGAGIDRARDGRELPPHLLAAVNRLSRLADHAEQDRAFDGAIRGTNREALARDFSDTARATADVSGRAELNSDGWSLAVGGAVRTNQDGSAFKPDGTQLVVLAGNWAFHAGWSTHWFGPGSDGALLFSNSARPFPKFGVTRLMPEPIDFPVLRWLGPVRFEIFGGVLDEKRRDYNNIITVGTRLSFEPAKGLQIGLNRAQMLCGKGRPCGFKQIFQSFVGIGNADNPTPGDPQAFLQQAGNQLAGFDISYTHRFPRLAVKLYAEAEAEDFDNIILEQYGRLIGMTLSGPLGRRGASWSFNMEYADTQAASLFNGTPLEKLTGGETVYPGSLYNNSLYFDGFAYNKRPIGYWTDGDSRNLAFNLSVTDTSNRRWFGVVRSVHLNFNNVGNPPFPATAPDGTVRGLTINRVSANNEKFAMLGAGVEWPTSLGDLRLEGRWQGDSPNTPGRRAPKGAVEAGWRVRF
ncbi:capsule assembly Wzi family protein [Sandaracinobacteroides saxicola]|uniref:Capsule assembly Wzi family protein n=1 Tax=Sandaracinobacteroides saxicola TaxID=2759707 RepID=A0A7G5IEN7_9SPHN|nr:capsule assembly Wzi family protein [Sandaracinobacteroides saxicola]QMW21829.1 hypothetical protein H3309_10525 [Sandaracinobacteroides saxicola]